MTTTTTPTIEAAIEHLDQTIRSLYGLWQEAFLGRANCDVRERERISWAQYQVARVRVALDRGVPLDTVTNDDARAFMWGLIDYAS